MRDGVRRIQALAADLEAKERQRGAEQRTVTAIGALGMANAIAGVVNSRESRPRGLAGRYARYQARFAFTRFEADQGRQPV